MDKIAQLRKEIDEIDKKIMTLLDDRFTKTNQIGQIKHDTKSNILDKNREDNILNKTSIYSHYPEIKVIYKTIMSESKKSQRK